MKFNFAFILLIMLACNSKPKNAQQISSVDSTYLASMDGIGNIKTGMSQSELEALLQTKIPLTNPSDSISGSWVDTATVRYNNVNFLIKFVRSYTGTNPDDFYMRVDGIITENSLCKTDRRIGIGSTKQEIIAAYPDKQLFMHPGYDSDTATVFSKSIYTIIIRDDREGPQIVCYLKDNKTNKLEVSSFYDDQE